MKNKKVFIICVLYFPDIEHIKNLIRILNDTHILCFVDNTPNVVNNYLKLASETPYSNLIYKSLGINMGIATAQNIGIDKGINRKDIDFLLFLDQDSIVPEGFISNMLIEYGRISKTGVNISALGPTPVKKGTLLNYKQEQVSQKKKGKDFINPSFLISSGMLISQETIEKVGTMEEILFIDLVDFEWCWRARSKGFVCCMTEKVTMEHKVGQQEKSLLGFPIIISSPIRYYYQYRNFLFLINRSYVPFKWKSKNLIKRMLYLVYIPLFCSNGRAIAHNMVKGIKSGIMENRGKQKK